METNFNTIALGYFNSKGELVAWSSDTFGSPSKYPKTYRDSEHTRIMLLNKVTTLDKVKESAQGLANLLGNFHEGAKALVESSSNNNTDFFTKNDVVEGRVVALDLVTDYSERKYLPSWEEVVKCVDEGKFNLVQ